MNASCLLNSFFILVSMLQIFTGKLVVGINDSKELCYLHLTNPMEESLLLEATKLAQNQCLERVNWFKELCKANMEEREVPQYQRAPEPNSSGATLDLNSFKRSLSDLKPVDCSITASVAKEEKLTKDPKFDISDIQVLQSLTLY